MIIAKTVGSVVSSVKEVSLNGAKLLLVRAADPHGNAEGPPFVVIDTVGAGEDELVVVAQGSVARLAGQEKFNFEGSPVDATVIGVIDSIEFEGDTAFRKS